MYQYRLAAPSFGFATMVPSFNLLIWWHFLIGLLVTNGLVLTLFVGPLVWVQFGLVHNALPYQLRWNLAATNEPTHMLAAAYIAVTDRQSDPLRLTTARTVPAQPPPPPVHPDRRTVRPGELVYGIDGEFVDTSSQGGFTVSELMAALRRARNNWRVEFSGGKSTSSPCSVLRLRSGTFPHAHFVIGFGWRTYICTRVSHSVKHMWRCTCCAGSAIAVITTETIAFTHSAFLKDDDEVPRLITHCAQCADVAVRAAHTVRADVILQNEHRIAQLQHWRKGEVGSVDRWSSVCPVDQLYATAEQRWASRVESISLQSTVGVSSD